MSTVRQPTSAMISVIEKARGRSDEHPSVHFFSLALLAVFFVALMTCLVAGAHVYRTAAQAQEQANERHLGSGLIANIVRAHDTANVARIAEGPEGPALVLARRTASSSGLLAKAYNRRAAAARATSTLPSKSRCLSTSQTSRRSC